MRRRVVASAAWAVLHSGMRALASWHASECLGPLLLLRSFLSGFPNPGTQDASSSRLQVGSRTSDRADYHVASLLELPRVMPELFEPRAENGDGASGAVAAGAHGSGAVFDRAELGSHETVQAESAAAVSGEPDHARSGATPSQNGTAAAPAGGGVEVGGSSAHSAGNGAPAAAAHQPPQPVSPTCRQQQALADRKQEAQRYQDGSM